MKLRFFNEGDASCDSGASSASIGDISGVNTSAGSNVVNYGPNNPYFSNLASYKKKNKKDDAYNEKRKDNKKASHSRKTQNNRYNPKDWDF